MILGKISMADEMNGPLKAFEKREVIEVLKLNTGNRDCWGQALNGLCFKVLI